MEDIEVLYVDWWEELEQGSQLLWKTDMKIYYDTIIKTLNETRLSETRLFETSNLVLKNITSLLYYIVYYNSQNFYGLSNFK